MKLLKKFHDSRCPAFGGFEYKGRGKGMGRFIGNVTFHGRKVNGKVVISNGAY